MKTIQNGPVTLPDRGDSRRWLWRAASFPGMSQSVCFSVTKSALATAPETMPRRVVQSIRSLGGTEIQRLLDSPRLPERIEVNTDWLTLHYHDGERSRLF